MRADAIPVAHTPPGGYGDEMPPPVLAECTEPLVDDAPPASDLLGPVTGISAHTNHLGVDGLPISSTEGVGVISGASNDEETMTRATPAAKMRSGLRV